MAFLNSHLEERTEHTSSMAATEITLDENDSEETSSGSPPELKSRKRLEKQSATSEPKSTPQKKKKRADSELDSAILDLVKKDDVSPLAMEVDDMLKQVLANGDKSLIASFKTSLRTFLNEYEMVLSLSDGVVPYKTNGMDRYEEYDDYEDHPY
uniref:Uncharacterized protein n=1 Tax=Ditylenchus dipsaci TaxID=166011 RepID=A0A915DST5_9BILA